TCAPCVRRREAPMQRSTDRILTTHVGKLPAPDDLVQAMLAHPQGRPTAPAFAARLKTAVADVVRRQADIGIDVLDDGEFGKTSWNSYLSGRLGGYERRPLAPGERGLGRGGTERQLFDQFYKEAEETRTYLYYRDPVPSRDQGTQLVCMGPIK